MNETIVCGRCCYYEALHGLPKGYCHGLPPTLFPSGVVASPEVKSLRRGCSLFKPLPEGAEPMFHEKTRADTPGDAARAARLLKRK